MSSRPSGGRRSAPRAVEKRIESSVMAALLRRLWLTVLALTIAAIVAGAVVDTESNGKLWFFLWSLLSRGWNGGDRIAVNDVTIYYETFGSWPPVLVLHGGLGSLVDMRYQIE